MKVISKYILLVAIAAWCFHLHASAQSASPHIIVYKTTKNYSHNVPVELSADKKTIISYPAPSDLKAGDDYLLPITLHKGYLLDKKGISKNVAFLKMTYEQYAKLPVAPSLKDMYHNIANKTPLKEYYDCGSRGKYKSAVKSMNSLIDKKQISKACKKING